jgi:hypothetical protein
LLMMIGGVLRWCSTPIFAVFFFRILVSSL